MFPKKLILSVAVMALALALPDRASAQDRLRLRADFVVGAPANSNYEERPVGTPRKIEFQVQNVRPQTTSIDAWVLSLQTGDFVLVATFPVVGGIGRIEHETQLGQFVPNVDEIDLVLLFDSLTYDLISAGF